MSTLRMAVSLVATVALLVAGRPAPAQTAGSAGTPYHNVEKGFSITFPPGWGTKEGFMGSPVLGFRPAGESTGEFRENVVVTVDELAAAMSVAEYHRRSTAALKAILVDCRLLGEGRGRIGGRDTCWASFSHRMGFGIVRALAYCFVNGKRGYAVTCSATPETFAQYKTQFQQIAGTFRTDAQALPAPSSAPPAEAGAVPAPAAPSAEAPGMRRYAAKGYTIAFPHKWDVPPSGSATGMVALSPQEGAADLFRENVIVVVDDLPEGATLDVYRRNGR